AGRRAVKRTKASAARVLQLLDWIQRPLATSAWQIIRARKDVLTYTWPFQQNRVRNCGGSIFRRVHLAAGQQILIDGVVLLAGIPIQRLAERCLAIFVRE